MSGSQPLHRTHLMGEPDLARNYSIRLRWMVLLSLLAFLPCSQVSVWLAVEQLDAVVDHQQAALHPDRLLRGHVDQLIGVPDLGLLVRTFARESTFPGVALQEIYEILRPKYCEKRPRGASCWGCCCPLLARLSISASGLKFTWNPIHCYSFQINKKDLLPGCWDCCPSLCYRHWCCGGHR